LQQSTSRAGAQRSGVAAPPTDLASQLRYEQVQAAQQALAASQDFTIQMAELTADLAKATDAEARELAEAMASARAELAEATEADRAAVENSRAHVEFLRGAYAAIAAVDESLRNLQVRLRHDVYELDANRTLLLDRWLAGRTAGTAEPAALVQAPVVALDETRAPQIAATRVTLVRDIHAAAQREFDGALGEMGRRRARGARSVSRLPRLDWSSIDVQLRRAIDAQSTKLCSMGGIAVAQTSAPRKLRRGLLRTVVVGGWRHAFLADPLSAAPVRRVRREHRTTCRRDRRAGARHAGVRGGSRTERSRTEGDRHRRDPDRRPKRREPLLHRLARRDLPRRRRPPVHVRS
jgi:hypothetical protein